LSEYEASLLLTAPPAGAIHALSPNAGVLTRDVFLSGDVSRLVAAGKAEFKAIRQRAMDRAGRLPGQKAAQVMSDEVDGLVRAVYFFFRLEERRRGQAVQRTGHCLMAHGGYGRQQLSIFSDIDLQFLVVDPVPPELDRLIGDFYKALWDIGMELGAVVRTTSDCLAFVGRDLKSVTSLLDIRHLTGSRELLAQLEDQLGSRICQGTSAHQWFLRALGEAACSRYAEHGGTEFVLEPDIKDGIGALRDHHDLRWWLATCRPFKNLRQLHDARVITSADLQRLQDGYNFLMTLRSHLHRLAKRKTDSLVFDYHRPVALAMRFRQHEGMLPEEQLMREYYIHAHRIRYLSERIKRNLAVPPRESLMGRFVGRITEKRIAPYFVLRQGSLMVDERRVEDWRADAEGLMLVFLKQAQLGARLSGRLIERVRAEVDRVDAESFRRSPYNRDTFMRVLGDENYASRCIRMMHECGVLDLYLPEFAHLFCLVRADNYHRYTVDEHTFRTLEAAEGLLQQPPEASHVARVARRIDRWPLLMLSLLFHDIGKGLGHGHAVRGGVMVGTIAERMALPVDDTELVHFLVVQHLKMSHLALRRDLSDPRVAHELASVVQTRERLDCLYILTYSDISGVAPGMWNNWKAQLFRELYERTAQILATGQISEDEIYQVPADLSQQIEKHLDASHSPAQLARFMEMMPMRYLHYSTPRIIASHFRLMRQRTSAEPLTWELVAQPEFDRTLLVVCAPDLPGLFHLLTRALASKRLSITSAICFATSDGVVLDEFGLTFHDKPLPTDFRLDRLRQTICAVLRQEQTVEEAFGHTPELQPPDANRSELAPTQVKVDNDTSDQWTVCEVKTHDRPGLLSVISGIFVEFDLYIHQAIITTEAYRVVDVFYLSTLENTKFTDRGRLKKLEQRLFDRLTAPLPEPIPVAGSQHKV